VGHDTPANGGSQVVPRAERAKDKVAGGDAIEGVHFVGGG